MLKFSAKMAILYLALITQQEIRPLDHVPKQKAHSVERGKLISFFFSPWLRLKQDVYFVVL